MSKKKKKHNSFVSAYLGSRNQWTINPVTRVKQSKKVYNRKKLKNALRKETGRIFD